MLFYHITWKTGLYCEDMQISFIFPSVPSPRLMISNHVNHECLAQSYKDEVLRMKGLSRADLMISNHVNHVFVV